MSEDAAVTIMPQNISTSALESMERVQIDVQISTAKRYPRDIAQVKRGIESMATLDQDTAESCFFSLPRGGKTIQGPGVRLAEIAIHNFGNIRVQTRIVETEATGATPHVVIQAVCVDLEKNVAVSIEKRRRITGKKSKGGVPDEDDINLATNACAAIAFRDAAFKIVPMALLKPAYEAAKRVAIGDAKTLVDRRATAIEKFTKMGVQLPRILALLNKTAVDSVDLADLETLFGVFTAIKDGQTTIEEAFPQVGKAVEKPLDPSFGKDLAAGLAVKVEEKPVVPPQDKPKTVKATAKMPQVMDVTPETTAGTEGDPFANQ